MEVDDLFVDLADGIKLLKLLEIISGEKLGKPNSGRMRVHKIENVNKSLAFLHTKVNDTRSQYIRCDRSVHHCAGRRHLLLSMWRWCPVKIDSRRFVGYTIVKCKENPSDWSDSNCSLFDSTFELGAWITIIRSHEKDEMRNLRSDDVNWSTYFLIIFHSILFSFVFFLWHTGPSWIDWCWRYSWRESTFDTWFDLDHHSTFSNPRNRNWCGTSFEFVHFCWYFETFGNGQRRDVVSNMRAKYCIWNDSRERTHVCIEREMLSA